MSEKLAVCPLLTAVTGILFLCMDLTQTSYRPQVSHCHSLDGDGVEVSQRVRPEHQGVVDSDGSPEGGAADHSPHSGHLVRVVYLELRRLVF